MALHYTVPSLIQESLLEKLLVSKYCIEFRKDPTLWKSNGCYGHPALVLLLSIADTIGSYVIGGKVKNHFDILNDDNYYDLKLSKSDVATIYYEYRCLSAHNSLIGFTASMDIGKSNNQVIEMKNNMPTLFLTPLYNASVKSVINFFDRIKSLDIDKKALEYLMHEKS